MQEDPDVGTFIRWTSFILWLNFFCLHYINGRALPTLSPLMSPIQRTHYSYQDDQLSTQNGKCSARKMCHAVLRPAQTLWVQNVRQSFIWSKPRAWSQCYGSVWSNWARSGAEKNKHSWWKNSNKCRTRHLNSENKIDRDNQSGANHCRLPYSSFVSNLHKQEEWRRQTTRRNSSFDDSLDGRMNSILMFDDYSTRSMDHAVSEQDGSTCKRRDHEIVRWLTFELECY